MTIQKLPGSAITPGTITVTQLESSVATTVQTGGGPKITAITVTNNAYTNLDDTAVNVSGGYIKITGTGFVTGCSIIIGSLVATSVSFISSTEVRAQVPAQSAGTYTVYLVNPDGGVGIRVNGLNYSSTPTWSTTSPLPGGVKDSAISIQLVATSNSAVTFSLQAGSTLPAGLTLSSGGLLSGTVTGISVETTYNFTIVATDAENQDTPQAFQITIVIGDPYYRLVTLHLPGTGTNLAQNNTFLDSSSNNFTITRNGNTTQGTFSPFSQTGWGNYFNGSNAYLSLTATSAVQLTDSTAFAIEFWVYPASIPSTGGSAFVLRAYNISSPFQGYGIAFGGNALNTNLQIWNGTAWADIGAVSANTWTHVAVTYEGSGTTLRYFINGTQQGSATTVPSSINYTGTPFIIGARNNDFYLNGYISNLRIVKGSAVYTSNFTPSTTPLTAISGTALLTCQSNRFIDNSTNAFTLTPNGSPSVVAFSPFAPTQSYSAAAVGGSGYFDGNGDELNAGSNAAFGFGTSAYTVELWVYLTAAVSATHSPCFVFNDTTGGFGFWNENGGSKLQIATRAGVTVLSAGTTLTANTWNHIVAVRSGTGANQTSIFVNGSRVANGTDATNYTITGPLKIGGISLSNFYVNGYLSNVRIVKGSAVYDPTLTTLTVPTAPLTAVSNTSLLLNFTNAGITDATAKNDLETVGNAQISTTQSKWGGGSMYFDGTGDYLRWTTSNFFNVYQGSNTVEMWIYPTSISSGGSNSSKYGTLFVQQALGSSIQFGLGFNSSGQLVYTYWNGSATVQITSTETLSVNTWSHVGFTYTSSGIALFVNGVYKAPTAITGSPSASATEPMFIGIEGRTAGSELYYQGYIDDLRITKGYARYTSNFTAPTGAFPAL